MGQATGFQYFYQDVLALDVSRVITSYDFHLQSGNQVPNQSWATNSINGTVNNPTNFYSSSGSGAFNGTTYIHINSGINLSSWTAFFTYERVRSGIDEILFSTMTGSNFLNSSGVIFGINQANKLYLEYWNNVDGPQIFTFSEIIGDKNMVSVTKSDSAIFFNYYDVNSKLSTVEQNVIYQGNFIGNLNWYIGGRPNGGFLIPTNNFSGYIDNFFLISGDLDQNYQQVLFSGFFSDYRTGAATITTVCSNIVYQSGINTGIATGDIGYQTVQISSYIDQCGRDNILYSWSGVTGVFSGSFFVPVSGFGSSCVNYTGLGSPYLFIDTGYLFSFGMDQISLLWTIDSGDFCDVYALTGLFQDTTRNKIAQYNALQDLFFLDSTYSSGSIGLYLNGQLQLQSGLLSYQDGYDTRYILTGDYFLSGSASRVYSTGYYQNTDVLLYDVVNGTISSIFFTGGSGAIPGIDFTNKEVFLNGQKLTYLIDYANPNILYQDIGSGQNVISVYQPTGNNIYVSGFNTGFLQLPKFLRKTSQVYFNGVRGEIGNYYVENSNLDLLSGNFLAPFYNDGLYLNTNDFLNY